MHMNNMKHIILHLLNFIITCRVSQVKGTWHEMHGYEYMFLEL